MNLDGLHSITWTRVSGIVAGGALVRLATQYLIGLVHRRVIQGEVDLDSEKRALTLIRAIRYAAGVIVAAIVLMLLLSEFGISIAPVPGAAGVAGVAVGLAAPGVARDLITGISVLLDNQLRVGDAVEIAGMDRWEADTDVIRAHVPVAASAQASTRREWLARVKAGLDSAGVPNPTRRIRLLAGASNGG